MDDLAVVPGIVENNNTEKVVTRNVDPKEINAQLEYAAQHLDEEPNSEIVKFFAGRNVFITGGTGYLGRVLIHKLLTYCPDIGNIYLLMREKKGVCQEKRLEDMKSHFLFEGIEKKIPGHLEKMRIVQGDVQEVGLAISEEDREIVKREVNIVFHSAATVKFDDLLSKSVSMNVRGTKELMDLAKEMKNLISYVHVSTCYVHCHRQGEVIREEIYPPENFSVREVLDMCEHNTDVNSEERTKDVIGERPNTYTFTKAITEQLVNENKEHLPMAIVRPSIVAGAMKEPLPGWVDNLNGPTGIVVACGHGVLRSMYANPDYIADIIPVDIVINLMCAVAYKTAGQYDRETGKKPDKVPVYNCNSGTDSPITWRELSYHGIYACHKYPFENILMPPNGTFQHSELQDRIFRFFVHIIPAYIVDAIARLLGHKPFLVRLVGKMHNGMAALEWFANRQWIWANDNVIALSQELNATDRVWFHCRTEGLDWQDYFVSYYYCARKHLLKYKDDSLDASRVHLKRLVFVFEIIKGTIAFALVLYAVRCIACFFF